MNKIDFSYILTEKLEGTDVSSGKVDILVVKDVSPEIINDHLRLHSGLLAYYNDLKLESKRILNKLNRQFAAFKKTAYNTIGKELKSEKRVGTVTINDIEAERNIKYSKSINSY